MDRILKLRREAEAELNAAKALQAKADEETRDLTEEEVKTFDAHMAKREKLLAKAQRLEDVEQADAQMQSIVRSRNDQSGDDDGDGDDAGDGAAGGDHGAAGGGSRSLSSPIPGQARDQEAEGRRGFAHFGDFAFAVQNAYTPGGQVDRRLGAMMAADGGSQGVAAEGGYLVPPTFSQQLWDGLNEDPDSLMNRCDRVPVPGESITLPKAKQGRNGGIVYGGVQAFWIEEAESIPTSRPKFDGITLRPHELGALVYMTDKLLRNSPLALDGFIRKAATLAISHEINDAIWDGDGTGKPIGVLRSGALVTVSKETGQPADTILIENIVKMYARFIASRRRGAAWFINQDIEPQLFTLQYEGASGSFPAYMPAGGISSAPFATLLGRPVVPIDYAKTLGDAGDIVLSDLGLYALGEKSGGIRSAQSIHLRFDTAQTAFRFMFEIDGQPWMDEPITPVNGANTLSTFVALESRA